MDVTASLAHLVPAVVGAPGSGLAGGAWLLPAGIVLFFGVGLLCPMAAVLYAQGYSFLLVASFPPTAVAMAATWLGVLHHRDVDRVEQALARGEAAAPASTLVELVETGSQEWAAIVAVALVAVAVGAAVAVLVVWRVMARRPGRRLPTRPSTQPLVPALRCAQHPWRG